METFVCIRKYTRLFYFASKLQVERRLDRLLMQMSSIITSAYERASNYCAYQMTENGMVMLK